MFSSSNNIIMISGIFLALTFICGLLYFVNKMFANNTQDILVRFILLVFTALVGVWVVDKVIAFKVKLLDAEQGAQLFDLIKTLVLMIFSYYFGSKKSVENKN
jgi:hypothetical protein